MKREFFNKGYALLMNAFPHSAERLSAETQEIYWNELQSIPEQRYERGVRWCVTHSEFFPSIAKLGAACYDGNTNWSDDIAREKRKLFERKQKQLTPPMSEAERRANQGKLLQIASDLGKAKAIPPLDSKPQRELSPVVKQTVERMARDEKRRDELREQAKKIGAAK